MRAEGGATAVLAVLSLVNGKPTNLVGDARPSGAAAWVRHGKPYTVPDDPSVQLLLICSVDGQSGAAWFDDVSVMYGESKARRDEAPLTATIMVDANHITRQIPRTLFGANVEWIWNGNFAWLERERRPDPALLSFVKEMGISVIRYPGGYYSDFYHWKDGVGPVEKRPAIVHDASGKERSRPVFGTDEALDFASQVGAELLITVNAGTGTAQEAADWVRYVNGKRLRVRYWEVGNELYINDGSAIAKATAVDPSTYARLFREFAQAMKAADPRIQVGAIGGENQGPYAFVHDPSWNKTVLKQAGDQIDFFSVHNAYAPVSIRDDADLRSVYQTMFAAPLLIAKNLAIVARQTAEFYPGRVKAIPIAVTEWGPLFQTDPKGRYAQHTKTLGSALFVASTLKTLIESPTTEIANFHVLNDLGFMGWIGSTNDSFPPHPEWTPTARYYAFMMFARYFGTRLLRTEAATPTYDSVALGAIAAVEHVPYLDVVSSLSADGRELYVSGINKHFDSAISASIELKGFVPASPATAWTLNGSGIDANTGTNPIRVPGLIWAKQVEDSQNPRFSKGGTSDITFTSQKAINISESFRYLFPPHSVTSIVLSRHQ